MTGEIQTVPARHGVATFVPARHTLKVINTYGTQTVDVWAFALHKPPPPSSMRAMQAEAEEEGEVDVVGDVGEGQERGQEGKEKSSHEGDQGDSSEAKEVLGETKAADAQTHQTELPASPTDDTDETETTPKASPSKEAPAPPQKGSDENESQQKQQPTSPPKPAARSWSAYASYVPSLRSRSKKATTTGAADATNVATSADAKAGEQRPPQRTVSSYAAYLPSLRGRAKEVAAVENKDGSRSEERGEEEKEDAEREKETEKERSDLKEDDKSLQSTSDYVSAEEGEEPQQDDPKNDDDSGQETDTEQKNNNMSASATSTKSWGSYLPSIPIRKPGSSNKKNMTAAAQTQHQRLAKDSNAKGWLSYIPSGKSFTSYLPPKGKEALSAFAASHYRDPTKSYGEQLYEFSKTPVGAFGLSAAAGSGTAGSLYAAYNAYVKLQATRRSTEPMEYLSLSHTVSASTHLAPQVGDALVTNLRNPLLTLLEDTTPPTPSTTNSSSSSSDMPLRHGTLLPACDPTVYAQLASLAGGARGEEHGSCAENLVLALQSFNKSTRLAGARAVGADVTLNSVPTPLSLFLNSAVDAASGAVRVGSPRTYEEGRLGRPGMKGGYVVLRAERDVVVVLSACPMEVGDVNGGRCMAANFVVEEPSASDEQGAAEADDEAKEEEAKERLERARAYGRALGATAAASTAVPTSGSSASSPSFAVGGAVKSTETLDASAGGQQSSSSAAGEVTNRPRPGRRKPRKLERRSGSAAAVVK
ncbi:hypothetical protein IWZ01DRAFT_368992 [Phyllosticta capitalensis]